MAMGASFKLLLLLFSVCGLSIVILCCASLEKILKCATGSPSIFKYPRPCQDYLFVSIEQQPIKQQKRQYQREVFLINVERFKNETSLVVTGLKHDEQQTRRRSLFAYESTTADALNDTFHIQPTIRIIGGNVVTDTNLYPSFAFTAGEELCGATLIHTDILMTAAHCLGAFKSRGALIGGTKLDSSQSQYALVDRELPHPNYTKGTEENDIMLVRLSSYISTPTVILNFNDLLPNDNEISTIIGFGLTSANGTFSEVLKETTVNVVPFDQCNTYYGDLNNESVICAGTIDGSSDSCRGDSGGPLFISASTATNDNVNLQIGIVSYGDGCATPGIAAVYTRVSAYEQWIQQGICDLSDNPPADCVFSPTTSPPSISPIPTFYMPPLGSLIPSKSPTNPSTDAPTESPLTRRPSTHRPSTHRPSTHRPSTHRPSTYRPTLQVSDTPTTSTTPIYIVRPVREEKSPRASQQSIHGQSTPAITTINNSSKPQKANTNHSMKELKRKKKSGKSSMKRKWKIKKTRIYHNVSSIDTYEDSDRNIHKIHRNSNNNYNNANMIQRKSYPQGKNQIDTMGKERHPKQGK